MIVWQDVVERTNSPTFCWCEPKKAVLAQTCMGVFFIREVSDTIFTMLFFSETAADHLANHRRPPLVRGQQFEKLCLIPHKTFVIDLFNDTS
jgi:hypothetical protein